jgi:hypothetical protein
MSGIVQVDMNNMSLYKKPISFVIEEIGKVDENEDEVYYLNL